MFAFSPIARTVAAEMPDQVPYKVKNERLRQVIALQNRITIEKNIGLIGQVFEVMKD